MTKSEYNQLSWRPNPVEEQKGGGKWKCFNYVNAIAADIIKYMIFALGMALRTISALRDIPAYSRIFKDVRHLV